MQYGAENQVEVVVYLLEAIYEILELINKMTNVCCIVIEDDVLPQSSVNLGN